MLKGILITVFTLCLFSCASFNKEITDFVLQEKLALQVLTKDFEIQDEQNYCLLIAGNKPSNGMTHELHKFNINPTKCEGDNITRVWVDSFIKNPLGTIELKYEYWCGALCAAEFNCRLSPSTSNKYKLEGCKLLWIS